MPVLMLSTKKFSPLMCAVASVGFCMLLATAQAQDAEPEVEDLTTAIEQAKNYCEAVADQAKEARIAWQMRALFDVEQQMKAKIAELDVKISELRSWVKRRDDILRRAEGHVVDIYANMRPDAAALQLTALDDETAISILLQMKARKASSVLAELEAERAAYLTDLMAEFTTRKANTKNLGVSQ
ncbi:MotE family protein [Pseudovibrio sp. Tun.PSC04-5.I4]|uniref:MotE family protein n=1 Tax=Pseudovibrio sp. Tun.PSC04-5.I4 TaxID=1798213 RepID=UPI0008854611|nr:MotE family protein [Pseudovibrio sp. Tun.PSC04-5.I4]SDQ92589.1 Flagellar motility protein MotE, a chaperone for MotC folding [Pseudovibrio sp. Tun.PSC04-5.I4]